MLVTSIIFYSYTHQKAKGSNAGDSVLYENKKTKREMHSNCLQTLQEPRHNRYSFLNNLSD